MMKLVAIKDVPPGSLSLSSSSNEVLFRFPDGTGWRHSEISRDKGWGWDDATTVRLVVLLTGLSMLDIQKLTGMPRQRLRQWLKNRSLPIKYKA